MKTSLDRYVLDVEKYPLLTKAEEQQLYPDLKKKGEARKKARETLVNSNLRLVIKTANEYVNYGVDFEDLINEGNIGLVIASNKFNPDKKVKFITYAAYWIRQGILRALQKKARTIRIPVGVSQTFSKIIKYKESFSEKFNRTPSTDEIAAEFGLKPKRVEQIIKAGMSIYSLDKVLSEEDDESFYNMVEDVRLLNPSELAEVNDQNEMLDGCLNKLTKREKEIILRRFGVGDEKETLEDIGESLGITRERVRQIQNAALGKLKSMINKSKLYE
jgi:RNA polymerase sigma factor (sigma-70 family)